MIPVIKSDLDMILQIEDTVKFAGVWDSYVSIYQLRGLEACKSQEHVLNGLKHCREMANAWCINNQYAMVFELQDTLQEPHPDLIDSYRSHGNED